MIQTFVSFFKIIFENLKTNKKWELLSEEVGDCSLDAFNEQGEKNSSVSYTCSPIGTN